MASNTNPDAVTADTARSYELEKVHTADGKTDSMVDEQHMEKVDTNEGNLVYNDVDEEPELHARTYIALLSMFALNLVQVFALQSPPAVLSYIGKSLNNTEADTWVPNSLSLVQAVLGPVISGASDTFQARKTILVGSSLISLIGAAIAPGSGNIYRLIAAQTLIGVGFAAVPLAYAVPSEILPRKWRPMAQACMNIAAAIGAISGPLVIGALVKGNEKDGWRKFYWIQMGLWGLTALGIFVGYRPPKRHTRLDHLSFWQKLTHLDLPGCGLLTVGLTLFLTGLNLGGGLFSWVNVRTLVTLILGIVILIAFGVYEWKGTRTGILHHDLFKGGAAQGRTFAICVGLIFIEGIMLFSYIVFFPVMTNALFTSDPFKTVARSQPYWIAGLISTVIWGYSATRFRTIREPLFLGYLFFTAGIIGWCTIQPGDDFSQLAFAAVAGFGFGAPLILIISGVQLSTPHRLIATATAVTTSSRAVAATVFTAIFSAALNTKLDTNLPNDIGKAALKAGLPTTSLKAFITALAGGDTAALPTIPGVTPAIIGAGVVALKQAFADSIRVVYIIAAPFGALACIMCLFLGDLRKTMNYQVDAPVEDLHAKHHHEQTAERVA
ncbi:major facilitator superfamily domain-containing protein [Exophiala viscosa]|uniref:major facilitator superfamily domain-containing protein n=1 Tax=Exophiala viscosa TaxID=2486360 RepID=UPI00219F6C11|nr:major facilitator superfamily domain-containing protein [Exophiala viscosa]